MRDGALHEARGPNWGRCAVLRIVAPAGLRVSRRACWATGWESSRRFFTPLVFGTAFDRGVAEGGGDEGASMVLAKRELEAAGRKADADKWGGGGGRECRCVHLSACRALSMDQCMVLTYSHGFGVRSIMHE